MTHVEPAAPVHVTGHLAPVTDEIEGFDLQVEGSLPPELTGRLLRNGPNPLPGEPSKHWFAGHGMVHGIRLENGRAKWYRNRWVRTKALAGQPQYAPDGSFDFSVGEANTNVIAHGGKILALVESGFPHRLSPTLETLGVDDFNGRLTTAMTAHPKVDPATGELHFFGYGVTPPYVTYHKLSAAGDLVTSHVIDVPGPTMMHDFAITDRHAIFLDLPITLSLHRIDDSPLPFDWDDSYGARIGIMAFDTPGQVQWFDVDPSYVFHVGNAHTDDAGRIVLDAARYGGTDAAWAWENLGNPLATTGVPARGDLAGCVAAMHDSGLARLHRWTFDLAAGTVEEVTLDDRGIEFPTIDDARVGRTSRYRYAVSGGGPCAAAIVKFDTTAGVVAEHSLGRDVVAGEAVFVPSQAADRGEDDGWLLTVASRRDGGGSRVLVLDATDVAAKPVAAITLPRRVPAGFHGSWIPDDEIEAPLD